VNPRARARRPRRPLIAAGAVAAVMLLSAACGTRMSHEAVVSASGGQQAAGGVVGQTGTGSTAGTSTAPGASSGGVTGPGGTVSGGSSTSTTGSAAGAGSAAGGGTAGGATSHGSAETPTGTPLVIASVGNYSGIAGASEKDGPKALQIWAAWANDHGGVNGHPVKVYVVDDGMDPQRYQAAVKDLVENKHVIAFVDNFAPFTIQAGVKYLEQKRVPVIGGDCAEYIWNESPMLFPQCPSYVNGMYDIAHTAAVYGEGDRFGAIICSEAAACTSTKHEWFDNGIAKEAGLDPVFEADVSIGQPDFTAECLQAQRKDVQIMSVVADVGTVGRVVNSCDRQGFHPQYIQASGTMDANLAKLSGMANALVSLNDFPWTVSGNRGIDQFRSAYRTYAPDQPLTPNASQGWASAIVFAKAAAHVGATPTSAQILAGLWSLRGETFGGLTSPLTFAKDKPAPQARCAFVMKVQDGVMQSPYGLKTVCR
jgi:branched-chain amino acid transport system substrate-binding protein